MHYYLVQISKELGEKVEFVLRTKSEDEVVTEVHKHIKENDVYSVAKIKATEAWQLTRVGA